MNSVKIGRCCTLPVVPRAATMPGSVMMIVRRRLAWLGASIQEHEYRAVWEVLVSTQWIAHSKANRFLDARLIYIWLDLGGASRPTIVRHGPRCGGQGSAAKSNGVRIGRSNSLHCRGSDQSLTSPAYWMPSSLGSLYSFIGPHLAQFYHDRCISYLHRICLHGRSSSLSLDPLHDEVDLRPLSRNFRPHFLVEPTQTQCPLAVRATLYM